MSLVMTYKHNLGKQVGAAILLTTCLALAGCGTTELLGQRDSGGQTFGEKILTNLADCKRDYSLGIGAGITGGADVGCDPEAMMRARAALATSLAGIDPAVALAILGLNRSVAPTPPIP